jgi:WD40 repeat protein
LLATGGNDMSVWLWDPQTGNEQLVLRGHVDGISALSFAPNGSFLVTVGHDRAVKRWDLATLQENNILRGGGWVLALAFSPDGTKLASTSTGKGGANVTKFGEVKVWDVTTGRELATLPLQNWAVTSVDFAADGPTLAVSTEAGEITLWDLTTNQVKTRLQADRNTATTAVRFLPDGKTLAACTPTVGVELWDLATGQMRAILKDDKPNPLSPPLAPNCLALAPDGRTLTACDWQQAPLPLWDLRTEQRSRTVGHLGAAAESGVAAEGLYDFMGNAALAFSPDGRSLVHASPSPSGTVGRGAVRLIDLSSGQERLTFPGHRGEVWSVAFARDGKTLVSGSEDSTIKLWDPVTGDQRLTLRGHEGRISTVAFSPDGTILATASWDGTIRLWRTATRKEVDASFRESKR